jgi:hypothetical protein
LQNLGVNLTRLFHGGESALPHRHSKQDKFIYILQVEASRPWSPMPAKSLYGPACVEDFPRQAWTTNSSIAPLSTSYILKSGTAQLATRASTRTGSAPKVVFDDQLA